MYHLIKWLQYLDLKLLIYIFWNFNVIKMDKKWTKLGTLKWRGANTSHLTNAFIQK